MKTLHIKIADQIGISEDLFGWSAGFTALELEFRLQEIPNAEKIQLHISTAGGDVEEGLAIYNKLCSLREAGTEIGVIVESHCYSIGTLIAMAASPNQLQIRESALWCVHKPMYPAVFYANADDFRKYADNLDACEAAISAGYVRRTGKPIEEIAAKLREDKIVSAADAIADGWLDSTVENTEETVHHTTKATALKPVAFLRFKPIENQINSKNMAINNPKPETGISSVMAKLKGLATEILNISNVSGTGGSPKAEGEESPVAGSAKLNDDAGRTIYFDGELAINSIVFLDEAKTEALENGDHVLDDGRTITVLDGVVTAITDAKVEDEKDALLDAKDSEISELKARVAELESDPADIKKMEGMVATLSAEVAKLKKFVPDSGDKSKRSAQTNFPKTEEPKAKSALDINAANLKNK